MDQMNATTTIVHVVGARPNFMKAAPLLRVLDQLPGFSNLLVHTGQHYDPILSDVVLQDLGVRTPDVNLGVGSGTHATQTAKVMTGMERVFMDITQEERILGAHPVDYLVALFIFHPAVRIENCLSMQCVAYINAPCFGILRGLRYDCG